MRIDLPMTLGIMLLDMFKLRRLLPKSGYVPIQMPEPLVQRRVSAPDVPDVAFEMLHVDGIEADDGRVEADVGFGDVGAEVVRSWVGCAMLLFGEMSFCAVEGGEEWVYGFLVGGLGGGEAGFVDAVVDVVVGPFVRGFDLLLQILREQVEGSMLGS